MMTLTSVVIQKRALSMVTHPLSSGSRGRALDVLYKFGCPFDIFFGQGDLKHDNQHDKKDKEGENITQA